ncbi:heat-inducible transcriptional repressor HrcA [Chlamydia sp.]|uniref:heat-inducible transcriptional repressor HrcA n=1 Tax=Chlamydia sp. TaxID=35827 RepID=UPI0025C58E47|nr:heat-inducible transcriptional repressor HrcA [Chlamydia sp.]MBQ8498710.1 heat-inducible transcriptional repressor HrcA [Chlamydia sp.]
MENRVEMSQLRASKKDSKISHVLLMTTKLYLESGQPVGSKLLKETYCSDLSSATIRNYFAQLEAGGFLRKNHISGGRIPTDLAFRYYADHSIPFLEQEKVAEIQQKLSELPEYSKNIVKDLQKASEILSDILQLPVCFSSPRFESDSVINIQLVAIDDRRVVFVLSTEFGQVFTDVLWLPEQLPANSLKKIENFLQNYLRKQPSDSLLSQKEEDLGMILYNEVVVRYLTRYCHFSEEDLYQTGLSRLLKYEIFKDPETLAQGLSFFENRKHMCKFLNIHSHKEMPTAFIGRELADIVGNSDPLCAVITVPYYMDRTPLGAFGVLGPMNLPYQQVFGTLSLFAERLKTVLTQSFYKFKLSFRRPCPSDPRCSQRPAELTRRSSIKLLPAKELS